MCQVSRPLFSGKPNPIHLVASRDYSQDILTVFHLAFLEHFQGLLLVFRPGLSNHHFLKEACFQQPHPGVKRQDQLTKNSHRLV